MITKEEREAMRKYAREQDEKGSGLCMCGGDANNLWEHSGHGVVEPSMADVGGPCDETRLLDALEAAEAELARLRPLVEAAKVFVDLVENNWECDCDARHVAVCRSCEATALMARLSGVSP